MRSTPTYTRVRKDGTRETVIVPPSGEPIWLAGEPAWHAWFAIAWWFVLTPLLAALMIWSILHG